VAVGDIAEVPHGFSIFRIDSEDGSNMNLRNFDNIAYNCTV
jgi:hypothetical protein